MHDHNPAGAVAMGMRVFFGRAAMCGTARVADTVSSVQRFLSQRFFEVAELALRASNLQFMIFVNDGNTCRVVAAVFELSQAVDYQRHDLFVSDVSDYSTHRAAGKR